MAVGGRGNLTKPSGARLLVRSSWSSRDDEAEKVMSIVAMPRIVMIHVPVEPSPPNVQNSAISSLHSSNSKASNTAHLLSSEPTVVVGCPFVCQ